MLYPFRPLLLASTLLLGACGTLHDTEPPEGAPRKETVWAVTDRAELIRVNAGQPTRVLDRKPLSGLDAGDRLVGIDYRVARGTLFALSAAGRLYTLDTASGRLRAVGNGVPLALGALAVGFDFNPAADRIRVVAADGRNWRLHPDTGALVAADGALRYADGDAAAGQRPVLGGAAYTYNPRDDKLTTNYALDLARGTLVRQGSLEGAQPVVSPNTGMLWSVGALGTGALDEAAFDIADAGNVALAALRQGGRTRLVTIDLASGRATPIGRIGDGQALWGLAIEP
jgi:outer membrane protein assembly factor BamB